VALVDATPLHPTRSIDSPDEFGRTYRKWRLLGYIDAEPLCQPNEMLYELALELGNTAAGRSTNSIA
jgi:hypothetical protein